MCHNAWALRFPKPVKPNLTLPLLMDHDVALSYCSSGMCCHAPCHNSDGLNFVSQPPLNAFF